MEERVASLEGRMHAQERRIDDVRDAIAGLESRIGSLEASMDARLTNLEARMDARFVGLEQRMTSLEGRMDPRFVGLEQRITSLEVRMDARFASLEQEGRRQFRWLAGTQVTTLGAMLAVMAGIVAAFAGR
jgi:uncharacterized coiled-coil protein SlyX